MANFTAAQPGGVAGGEDFLFSDQREPHALRAREILRSHAEIRALAGRNPWSVFLLIGIVLIQTALAVFVAQVPLWAGLAVAFAIGAFLDHALWVLIHECAHNLVFRNASWNRVAAIAANLPHVLPSAISFQTYHLKHHAYQGVYELDADIPNRWEARLVGHSALRKALWLLLFPIFQVTRPPRLREISLFGPWVFVNIGVQLAFDVAVWAILGPKALLYLTASFFFSVGLHPLGARWIQEHFLVLENQETSSYYGPLNVLALNVGHHNEHHDFPSVPWNRLPAVRRSAPEVYGALGSHRSWSRLVLTFIFDRRLSLFSRTVRSERGQRPAAASASVAA
jgi:sphingolipid 4-desaturase/C4-monooxygenase